MSISPSAEATTVLEQAEYSSVQKHWTGSPPDTLVIAGISSHAGASEALGAIQWVPTSVDASGLRFVPDPFCQPLAVKRDHARGDPAGMVSLGVTLNKAEPDYLEDELLDATVTADTDGYIYIDLVDPARDVCHLFCASNEIQMLVKANSRARIGSVTVVSIAPPHGVNLLIILWSSTPLYNLSRSNSEKLSSLRRETARSDQ